MILSYWILPLLFLETRLFVPSFFDREMMSYQEARTVATLADTTCTDENKTYTVEVKVHAQDDVVKSIHSVALGNTPVDESVSIKSYFGDVIDDLNEYLIRFKVQLHLALDGYNSDDFIGSLAFDKSCEKFSPVTERTSSAFSFMKQSFDDNIGVHLFVWACPYIIETAELHNVYTNQKCGKVIGVLWKGTKETKDLIKDAIIDALSGISGGYAIGDPVYDTTVRPGLCSYVTSCVGMDKSEIGQIIYGTEIVKYTNIGNVDFCSDTGGD